MKEIIKKLQPNDIVSLPAFELLKYIEGYERYQYVKRLNPTTFYEVYKTKIAEKLPIDEVVDILRKELA
jgi:hypothetical protein